MTEQEFLYLSSPESTARRAEWAHDEMELETIICAANEGHQHAGRRLTDLSVTLPGKTVEHIVWTWYSECLVQEHVLKVFKERGFSGFEVKPVKAVFRRSKDRPPRLWELVVTGWAGIAPPESGIKLIEKCPACGHMVYSGYTDPGKLIARSQWDGSDFFLVWPMPVYIFVTRRVAQAIRDEHLTGAVLKAPNDLLKPGEAKFNLSPGRLSYCMPEKRARDLGAAAGIY